LKVTKLLLYFGAFVASLACTASCHKSETEADGIRAAVTRHLTALNTLNLQAMDIDIANTSIQGNQASATVTFRPKTGAPTGASMQVSYQLEKRDGTWAVIQTGGVGGAIDHPAPGTNPHIPSGSDNVHGAFPDIRGLVVPSSPNSKGSLPPGHPPVKVPPPSQKQ
jgi:hypothetical protein